MIDEINHDKLKGKVERDMDFQESVCQRLKILEERQGLLFEKVMHVLEYYERNKKRTKSNIYNNRRKKVHKEARGNKPSK
tara:strand:- start:3136 stop:3375 length:240 start_codon:yes stop_codon:yes gene_type:complete